MVVRRLQTHGHYHRLRLSRVEQLDARRFAPAASTSARDRIGSFPIPVVFFHLEDGDWVDFPVPEFQAWAAALANVISITALATLPLWLISWRQHRNESTHNAA